MRPNPQANSLLKQLSVSFDKGEKEEFFRAWHVLLPPDMQAQDFNSKKLEFYLRIYFVVFVYHPHNSGVARPRTEQELKRQQNDFKQYLDTKGSELSRTSEFLAFYALPYIQNPVDHPSFASLFTMEWVNKLKAKLKSFIHENALQLGMPHLAPQSQLFALVQTEPGTSADRSSEQGDRLQKMQKTMVSLQRKEQFAKKTLYESQIKWTHFSSDIVRVCNELINVLEQHHVSQYRLSEA